MKTGLSRLLALLGFSAALAQPITLFGQNIAFAGLPFFGQPDVLPSPLIPISVPKNGTAPTITTEPASQSVNTGAAATFTVASTGTPAPIYQWLRNGRSIPGANAATYTIASARLSDAGGYRVLVNNGVGLAVSSPATLSVANPGVVSTGPQSEAIATGATAAFNVTAAGTGLGYQWQFDGLSISGATSSSFILANAGPGASGIFTVVISNGGSVVAEEAATLSVTTNARLTNLSARGLVGNGSEVLIVGFVSSGTGNKEILLRGVGPTLANEFGVTDALATPLLTLYGSNGKVIVENNIWGGTAALTGAFAQIGAFPLPATSADAALLVSLPVGLYSAQVSGVNGSTGIALAEIYDADTGTPSPDLVNISARAYVANGGSVLIAGFVVSGTSSETVLIRGIGPSLRGLFGLGNALRNTQVRLFDAKGNQITANSGWGNDPWISGTGAQVGAFPLMSSSFDSALLVTIPPGAYSAEVSSTDGSTGLGMAEIYEVR